MNHDTIDLGGGNSLVADAGAAAIYFADGSHNDLDLNDLGRMSEWLAAAWENLTGSPYEHHEIGVPLDDNEFAALIGNSESAIRKRAAVLPLFGDYIEMSSDPGPGTKPYGREQVLERDCE